MKLAIIGTSRGIGRVLAEEALRRGHKICCISRDGRPESHDTTVQARWIMGDIAKYDNGAALAVLAEAEAVLVALGGSSSFGAYPHNRKTIRVEGTESVLRAAVELGVDRIMVCSAFGATPEEFGQIPILGRLKYFYPRQQTLYQHYEQERLVHASDINYTIVKPGLWNIQDSKKIKLETEIQLSSPGKWEQITVRKLEDTLPKGIARNAHECAGSPRDFLAERKPSELGDQIYVAKDLPGTEASRNLLGGHTVKNLFVSRALVASWMLDHLDDKSTYRSAYIFTKN